MSEGSALARFLDLACLGYADDHAKRRREARHMLEEGPQLARDTIFGAAVAGVASDVETMLAREPSLVHAKAGLRKTTALVYLCYARLDRPGVDAQVDETLRIAKGLLDAGADPNERFVRDGYQFDALTGVMGEGERGVVHQPPHPAGRALAELLLDAGASPNAAQGLYNTHFTDDDRWLRYLLSRGLGPTDMVDWPTESPISTLDYLLGQAIRSGRVSRVRLLLAHGANPDRHDVYDGRPLALHARLCGHEEMPAVLADAGVPEPVLGPAEQFEIACAQGQLEVARELVSRDPSLLARTGPWFAAARQDRSSVIETFLALGLDVNSTDARGVTALHQVAWHGHLELARRLIGAGANPEIRDDEHRATAEEWAQFAGQRELADELCRVGARSGTPP